MGDITSYRRTGFRRGSQISGARGGAGAGATHRSAAVTSLMVLLPLALFAVLFPWAALTGNAEQAAAPETVSAKFSMCLGAERTTCVVDGDTIWLEGEKIRLADIDAPEIDDPACAAERAAGMRATARLTAWLNAGAFEVHPHLGGAEQDAYGRKLRILARDGTSAVETMIAEGVASRASGKGKRWC